MDLSPGYCDRNASTWAFMILSPILLLIATILLTSRTYIRLRVARAFWWDDVCLIFAFGCLVAVFGIDWRMVVLGYGRHHGCYTEQQQNIVLEFAYIANFIQILSTIGSRASIALLVSHLPATTRRFRVGVFTYTVFMALSLAVCAGLSFGICRPVQALWNSSLRDDADCWSATATRFIAYYSGVVGILSNAIYALLPVYFLEKLQMKAKPEFAMMALLGFGLVPTGCAIARVICSSTESTTDPLYDNVTPSILAYVESCTLMICAAFADLGPIVSKEENYAAVTDMKPQDGLPVTISRDFRFKSTSDEGTIGPDGIRVTRTWSVFSMLSSWRTQSTAMSSNSSEPPDHRQTLGFRRPTIPTSIRQQSHG